MTPTVTETESITPSSTVSPVNTATLTLTVTLTATFTRTFTPTRTNTAIATPTGTSTPGAQPTETVFEINDALIFPNPFNPALNSDAGFTCTLTQAADTLKIKIYTTSFRAISEIVLPGSHAAGHVNVTFASQKLANLANGLYYYVVEGTNAGGKARSKPGVLVVLK